MTRFNIPKKQYSNPIVIPDSPQPPITNNTNEPINSSNSVNTSAPQQKDGEVSKQQSDRDSKNGNNTKISETVPAPDTQTDQFYQGEYKLPPITLGEPVEVPKTMSNYESAQPSYQLSSNTPTFSNNDVTISTPSDRGATDAPFNISDTGGSVIIITGDNNTVHLAGDSLSSSNSSTDSSSGVSQASEPLTQEKVIDFLERGINDATSLEDLEETEKALAGVLKYMEAKKLIFEMEEKFKK